MNKLLGVVAALLLLAGCGSASDPAVEAPSKPGAATVETTESTPAEEPTPSEEPAADREYAVTIDGSHTTKDYEGKPALVVDFTFTNNSDEAANFMFAVSVEVFQDGIELASAVVTDDKKYDSDNSMKDIKPGKSLKVQNAFSLDNKKSDVEIEVSELISFDDTPLATKTIALK